MSNPPVATAAALAEQVADVTPLLLAQERLLEVAPSLQPLVGATGLQRGSSVALHGAAGALTLSFALVAHAAQHGAWVAVVGGPWIGLAAIEESGIPLDHIVFIDQVDRPHWSAVTAAVLDGFDIVVLAHPPAPSNTISRQLIARARERSAVLVRVGGATWPDAADLRFDLVDTQWFGVGQGHGHLQRRLATVVAAGRRGASRERRHRLWLPDVDGVCRLATPADLHRDRPAYAGSDIDHLVAADGDALDTNNPVVRDRDGVVDDDDKPPRHLRRVV